MLGEFNRVFNVDDAGENEQDAGDNLTAAERRNSRQYTDAAADQLLGLSGRILTGMYWFTVSWTKLIVSAMQLLSKKASPMPIAHRWITRVPSRQRTAPLLRVPVLVWITITIWKLLRHRRHQKHHMLLLLEVLISLSAIEGIDIVE